MSHTFTSLQHPLEKLQEAEHFYARLAQSSGLHFQFELNAFLSASRSVTFVLQKSFGHIGRFENWYAARRAEMKADLAMRFFLELRNISQKQGPISYTSGSNFDGRWSSRFVGLPNAVPPELVGRDISDCCASHLVKIANLLAACRDAFPFDSCIYNALSEEGMALLGFTLADVEDALSLPRGYTSVVDFPISEKLRYLREEFEPLDATVLERLTKSGFLTDEKPPGILNSSGTNLMDDIAALLHPENPNLGNPRAIFLEAIMQRIENENHGRS